MPDKTVIGFSGDGGAMYTIQAMWTAARHDIGAKFVVCNNRSYQLLKLNVQQYWRERGFAGPRVPRLVRPRRPGDPLRRARAQHGRARRRASRPPTRSRPRSPRRSRDDGPFLIDLMLHQEVPDHDEDAANRRPVAGTRAHS